MDFLRKGGSVNGGIEDFAITIMVPQCGERGLGLGE